MSLIPELDRRPLIVAVAGPNGAGKSTFQRAHLRLTGLHYIEPDALAKELGMEPYHAAELAQRLRETYVAQGESFSFETVFSDPQGAKLQFLEAAAKAGYTVVLCFIGLADAGLSESRVAMRVSQGGHDVPTEKIQARFPRVLANLRRAVAELPFVYVFDNSDLARPFRLAAVFAGGKRLDSGRLPGWLKL